MGKPWKQSDQIERDRFKVLRDHDVRTLFTGIRIPADDGRYGPSPEGQGAGNTTTSGYGRKLLASISRKHLEVGGAVIAGE